MAQQTAVEWLEQKIRYYISNDDLLDDIFEQAKSMEKEQIINAFDDGDFMSCGSEKDAINYYNETYSNGKKN